MAAPTIRKSKVRRHSALHRFERRTDQEYFGDGLAEELLNVLVQIDGLSVASRTSSFAFKGKNLPIPAIAQALGVATYRGRERAARGRSVASYSAAH